MKPGPKNTFAKTWKRPKIKIPCICDKLVSFIIQGTSFMKVRNIQISDSAVFPFKGLIYQCCKFEPIYAQQNIHPCISICLSFVSVVFVCFKQSVYVVCFKQSVYVVCVCFKYSVSVSNTLCL